MVNKNKLYITMGAALLLTSIFMGSIAVYTVGYMNAANEQKDKLITKYVYVQNTTIVTVPQIKEVIKEVPIYIEPTTIPTTTLYQITTTTLVGPDVPIAPPVLDNKTLTRVLNIIKEDKLRGISTPLPEKPIDSTLNSGRYFVNQSITFKRKYVSGTIPGQMMEVDEEEIPYRMSFKFNTETVYNVYIKYWNGTLKDITANYTKYRDWNG